MVFTVRWTPEAQGEYDRLAAQARASLLNRKKNNRAKPAKAEGLFKQVDKCIRLLLHNPRHPGLRTHEYDSIPNPHDPSKKVFEAYAQNNTSGAYRVFWCYGPGKRDITLIAITPHP